MLVHDYFFLNTNAIPRFNNGHNLISSQYIIHKEAIIYKTYKHTKKLSASMFLIFILAK